MNTTKYLLLTVLLLGAVWSLTAQQTERKIQGGLGISVHSFSTSAQFSMGTGQSFAAWFQMDVRNDTKLEVKFAHRQLMGYRHEEVRLSEVIQPTQIERWQEVNELTGLVFWDVDLAWKTTLSNNRRWAWGGGVKLAILDRPRGKQSKAILVTDGRVVSSETNTNVNIGSDQLEYDIEPLGRALFAPLDIGVFTQVSYTLIKGLDCTATFYQGGINLFGDAQYPNQDHHFLSQFSLGLNARIF